MTMRYFALTNGMEKRTPVGLVRFDTDKVTTEFFSAKDQQWHMEPRLIKEVVMMKEDAYEVGATEAEQIKTGVLATPVA